MTDSAELGNSLRARAERLARFGKWEASHPMTLTPAEAVAAIGALYRLLPPASRSRPIDTSGVARLHGALRRLPR